MKRLIIGQLPEDFDHHKDILLGPFCLIGHEDLYSAREKFNIEPDPFHSLDEMEYASKKTTGYANYILPSLCSHLNFLNNTDKSIDFWRVIILPWLLLYIQVIWERHLRVEALINKYANQHLCIELVPDKYEWGFQNILDFHYTGALNINYNEWLFSRLIERNMPSNWSLKYTDKEPAKKILPKQSWKRKLYDKVFLKLRCNDIHGLNLFESLIFSSILSFKKKAVSQKNINNRKETYKTSEYNYINEILYKFLIRGIPKCYTNLKITKKENIKGNSRRINIIGANYLYNNEAYKNHIAHCIENGETLISSQHGGYYGTLKVHPTVSEVEYKLNSFINWGWKEHSQYTCNAINLPSPLLSKFRKKQKRSKNLVFAGNSIYLLGTIYSSSPQPLQQVDYVKKKLLFLEKLDKNILNNLFYRPHMFDHNSKTEFEFLMKSFPSIKLSTAKSKKCFSECQLLILDHPGTTLHFSMATNIPTICFWDEKTWVMSDQAEPYFTAFKNAGILFNSGRDAASKVNEIWDDVDAWWAQKDIQEARQKFCWNYARTSKFWFFEWIKMMVSL